MIYESFRVAVDAVIFSIIGNHLCIYLNVREKQPFLGQNELPGGLLLPQEAADEALVRKVTETLNISPTYFSQFYTFTNPNRDPRARTLSIAYVALVPSHSVPHPEAFVAVTQVPTLAFDHNVIVTMALEHLRHTITLAHLRYLLPPVFPLNDLQQVYEIVMETKEDNRNFRKMALKTALLEKVSHKQSGVSHRPATLYRFRE